MNALCVTLVSVLAAALAGSVFLGCLQYVLAAAVAPIVGLGGEDTAVPMGVVMVASAALAGISYLTLTRSSAAPVEAAADLPAEVVAQPVRA